MAHTEQGYYKYDQDSDYIHHGNNVYGPGFTLLEGQQDSYDLPIEGWHFCHTPQEACMLFGVDVENYEYLTDDPDQDHDHQEHIDVV